MVITAGIQDLREIISINDYEFKWNLRWVNYENITSKNSSSFS